MSSTNPNKLYQKLFTGLKKKFCCNEVDNLLEYSRKRIDKNDNKNIVRFVCISDIHTPSRIRKERIPWQFPQGDVLLVAGDLTMRGSAREVSQVVDWLRDTPYSHRVVIAGNHDFCLDPQDDDYSPEAEAALQRECIYLRDSSVVLFDSLKIYGSPVTPEFHSMAFNVARGSDIEQVWSSIPEDTDILLTHGPPLGHGDLVHNGIRAGCADLLMRVSQVRPAYHVFGHIHEAYGVTTDGYTAFVNAACCNLRYFLEHQPLVFEFAVAEPQQKPSLDEQLESGLSLGN
ncbi:hypothetical protein BOX15_Mlig010922g1 [Macrostomum lignano]|uniref:Calcineurin-like phosphoesterase domain-containing protein n=2 Tax=Macrostomum lignano TaxID=282301 RepID=A0A267GIS9_9PLAT|nr:hypothetical protein BOX15_Mlig010922g1 [Macrostomum lignano]